MARRYARDNRGRFASSGSGATARGGRLRTAAGNKRKTQTMQASAAPKGTIGKPRGLKPSAIKPKAQISTTADRLRVKTQTRRAMRAERASVITPGQRSRLESGKGATMKNARLASTVAKPRTVGNAKQQVQSRVQRKLAATQANLSAMTGYGRTTQKSTYERQLKRQATLERAQTFLKTGKLPGKDNSIAFKRNIREATTRINQKRAARQATKRKSIGSISEAKAGRIISRIDANRPGLRKATGSARKTQNSIRTQRKATDFALAAGARARKQGKSLSVNESLQRAVKNASAKLARGRRR